MDFPLDVTNTEPSVLLGANETLLVPAKVTISSKGRTLIGSSDVEPFTAAEKTKLSNIEPGATGDQTGAEIVSAIDTELGSTAWKAVSGLTNEVLNGTVNGINGVFTTNQTPSTDVVIFVNGLKQMQGVDFTRASSTITFTSGNIPQVGDVVEAVYGTLVVGSGSSWGGIAGTLTDQSDLVAALALKANLSALSTVATTGSYNDLSDKPTIPGNSEIRAQVEAELVAGTNVTITPSGSGATRQLTISASGASSSLQTVVDADRTGLASDRVVQFTGLTTSRTYTLPAASGVAAGTVLVIADGDGSCRPFKSISIAPSGADTVSGAAYTEVLEWPFASLTIVSNGSNGWVIGSRFPEAIPANGGQYTRRAWAVDEDWIIAQSGNVVGWRLQSSGGVMGPSGTSTTNAIGYVSLTSGTATGNYSALGQHSPPSALLFRAAAQSAWWAEWDVLVPTLPDATNDFITLIGFGDAITAEALGRHQVFAIKRADNATNWVVKSAANGTGSVIAGVDTGVAVVAGSRVRLGIECVPGSVARFFINGALVYTDSTAANIINSNNTYVPIIQQRWVAGATREIRVDRTRWGMVTATANLR